MYSNEDFENFYIRYKAEGLPGKMSIQSFWMKNKVSWNLFNKWYTDTRSRIRPVSITGQPEEEQQKEISSELDMTSQLQEVSDRPLRIMVDIRMTNGMQIRQRNLSYEGLRRLVEKLEGLC